VGGREQAPWAPQEGIEWVFPDLRLELHLIDSFEPSCTPATICESLTRGCDSLRSDGGEEQEPADQRPPRSNGG
jgi:hypothetical protein